jgi:hypothetical protein
MNSIALLYRLEKAGQNIKLLKGSLRRCKASAHKQIASRALKNASLALDFSGFSGLDRAEEQIALAKFETAHAEAI